MTVLPVEAIGPILGATVALLIAFVAYPWQKSLDRKMQVALERRKIYLDYVFAFDAHFAELNKGNLLDCDTTFYTMSRALLAVRIYGSSPVIREALEANTILLRFHRSAAKHYCLRQVDYDEWKALIDEDRSRVKRCRHGLLVLMRADTLQRSVSDARDEIGN